MPEYLSPGVYVEDVPSAIKPIAGVGTSTAGFVGVAKDDVLMPLKPGKDEKYSLAVAKKPIRITSWSKFVMNFGDFQKGNLNLAHAVYGFFNNGGTACWISRVNKQDGPKDKDIPDSFPDDLQIALNSFEAIDEIAIVAMPGITDKAFQDKLLSHCEKLKDRFAILDSQKTTNFSRQKITGGLRNSVDGYGAIYFPWIQVLDPVSQGNIYAPPSGHLAGIYARSDAERGVHKAPANEIIRGALGVEHRLAKADQDALNPVGINVIRQFNSGITVWGARTWADPGTDPEWKYISTRRLINFLRESIEEGTRWVVFEPNDIALWQKIKRNITAFLTNIWRQGALFGETPEQAFFVKCDEETNPSDVRDLGQVVIEIGVAIVKPAEFVIFRISQWQGPTE